MIVNGKFEVADDLGGFHRIVASHNPTVVTFNSPGGAIYKAMELGRAIRQHRLSTLQSKETECASACSLAFLGGTVRYAETGSIGVHKSSFSGGAAIGRDEAVAEVQRVTADIMGYISEMGADPGLLQLALRYESWDMRYLSMSEMLEYQIVSAGAEAAPPSFAPADPPRKSSTTREEAPVAFRRPDIPTARSGRVRHPKGFAFLHAGEGQDTPQLAKVANGHEVAILAIGQRWYLVRVRQQLGYMHHNWVKVDQFVPGAFTRRYVQIASFEDWPNVERYVRYATLPVSVYLASNGWYAVTLADTFDVKRGAELVRQLKAEGRIPDDAFLTVGNTYAVKVEQ